MMRSVDVRRDEVVMMRNQSRWLRDREKNQKKVLVYRSRTLDPCLRRQGHFDWASLRKGLRQGCRRITGNQPSVSTVARGYMSMYRGVQTMVDDRV
jgi:hypothetical protein